MRALLAAALLSFAVVADAQVPSMSDGLFLEPNVTVPGSGGGAHLMQNSVDVGRAASRINAVLASAYTNATVTPSTILTVTLPVATFHCRGRVNGTDSTAGEGVSIVLNTAGLTASATSSSTGYVATTAPLISPVVVTASGASATFAVATFATGYVDVDAVLTVTTGGALTLTGAQNTHSTGTLTISKGSYLLCEPL